MQVNLSWAAVPGAIFYNIFRGTTTGGPYQQIAQSNPNPGQTPGSGQVITKYQDGPNNLVNGQNYFYRVSAVTFDGESAFSTPETAVAPPAAPAIPASVVAVIT